MLDTILDLIAALSAPSKSKTSPTKSTPRAPKSTRPPVPSPQPPAPTSPSPSPKSNNGPIYPWTPTYTFHITAPLCGPARRLITRQLTPHGDYSTLPPGLKEYGVKIIKWSEGTIMSDGSLADITYAQTTTIPADHRGPIPVKQKLTITVRADDPAVPNWAEYLLARRHTYDHEGFTIHNKPLNPRNYELARAHGRNLPIPWGESATDTKLWSAEGCRQAKLWQQWIEANPQLANRT